MKPGNKFQYAQILLVTSLLLSFSTNAAVVDDMVLLQGGNVTLGSPDSERQRGDDEKQHQVTLDPFYVSPFEVSQKLYRDITGKNPSYFHGDNKPVDSVTWYDAIEFCNLLSQKEGLTPVYKLEGNKVLWDRSADGYRLLTEAEWEYAARAGTDTEFNVGHQVTSDEVNFEGSYPYLIEENYVNHHDDNVVTSAYRDETIDVDALAPNAFNLYNMHGNVAEWVFDYYGAYGDNEVNPVGH